MPEKLLKRKSKSDVLPAVLKTGCNGDICPFTLELVEGCKIRSSIDGEELCFFMLESCDFRERGMMRK
jgi:hypothetical protein